MTSKATKVLKEALKLPKADRADIASCLYGTLDHKDQIELDASWDKEIARRLKEIDEGKAKLLSRKEAEKRMFRHA